MKVTIVGAGNMGRGIGTRVVAGGHEVEIADRDPEQARVLAEELGDSATALEPDDPFHGEVVVFALYYPGIKDAVREYADRLAGKVVVDITNPVNTDTWDDLATPPGSGSTRCDPARAQLVSDGGLRPLDVGPLRRARQLEQLGFLHIAVQEPLGLNFGSTIKVHS
jgi:predicted dinucleotide-binding enzyme